MTIAKRQTLGAQRKTRLYYILPSRGGQALFANSLTVMYSCGDFQNRLEQATRQSARAGMDGNDSVGRVMNTVTASFLSQAIFVFTFNQKL